MKYLKRVSCHSLRRRSGELLAVLLLMFVLPTASVGQDYPPTIPGAMVEKFKTVDGAELNLWVFLPEGHRASDSRPAMVFFFGGGWSGGSPAHFER